MYMKSEKGWLEHIDYILIDLICLNIAYILAYEIHIGKGSPYGVDLYRIILLVLCVLNVFTATLLSSYKDAGRRGYYKEFVSLLKQSTVLFLLGILFLFAVKEAHVFSRIVYVLTAGFYMVFDYIGRLVLRVFHKVVKSKSTGRSLLIITDLTNYESVINGLTDNEDFHFKVAGLILTDADSVENSRYPVVCGINEMPDYVSHNWVDEVLIMVEHKSDIPECILKELSETGVIIHIGLSKNSTILGSNQFVESFAGNLVLTSCMHEASLAEMFLKRFFDICVGIVGCLATGLFYLFIAPVIKIKSPGPVFFKQKRVGQNGKIFTMYKFRTMTMDAEQRKEALMAENRVCDGMMFKLDFDPRIIGNEILPDGTRKTGIGNLLRRTSLDEFPQFFNVLIGNMSLVGTRPPTLDEWTKYNPHHKARLAVKPGITGMWQVSGRSGITGFEEVVALDTEYINKWSIGLDIKIILKTFVAIFKRDGAM